MAQGFSIKMFIPDGDPNGLRIIGKSHWTGQGIVFSRSIYNDVKKRDEFTRPGVYVLVGENQDSSLPKIYIGEAETISDRLQEHYAKKDFWNWCIFFTSSVGEGFNKVVVKYLESRLVELALNAKLCFLDNTQTPKTPILSEADIADAEAFLLDMLDIYPLVDLEIFREIKKPKNKNKLLYIDARGIKATGFESSDGFVVCKDSQAHKENTNSLVKGSIRIREELGQKQILTAKNKTFVFSQDYPFTSPSAAAEVVLGRSSNGRIEWKDKNGKTLKELQESNN